MDVVCLIVIASTEVSLPTLVFSTPSSLLKNAVASIKMQLEKPWQTWWDSGGPTVVLVLIGMGRRW
jgi:hypothetical protein